MVGAGSAPDRAIYYRFDANSSEGTWAVYNASKPPVLIQNGTLLFYSTTATGLRSPMGAAEFTFESSGAAMDSDGTRGSAAFHELAPGSVLKGLMRRIDKTCEVIPHDAP